MYYFFKTHINVFFDNPRTLRSDDFKNIFRIVFPIFKNVIRTLTFLKAITFGKTLILRKRKRSIKNGNSKSTSFLESTNFYQKKKKNLIRFIKKIRFKTFFMRTPPALVTGRRKETDDYADLHRVPCPLYHNHQNQSFQGYHDIKQTTQSSLNTVN